MIRKLQASDRTQLLSIIDGISNFTDEEKAVAVELIDEVVANSNHEYYTIFVFEDGDKILGYYCIGKRALTDAVFDLYWIAVDPNNQNGGIGKQLLEHLENFIKNKNGRWILAETSSKENYTATRKFYSRNSYSIVTQIKDFYSIGDDLIVFGKYISQ